MVKIEVLASMPSASERMAVAAKPGFSRSRFGICVCGRALAGNYELAMDRADIPFVDVVDQLFYPHGGVSS
jgi:hypothetical protein